MKQLDIFGNEIDVEEICQYKIPGRKKFITMQEEHGQLPGKTCKTCKYLQKWHYHSKNYYKCELWRNSNSSATDIRLKNNACKKYQAMEEK